MRTAEGGTGRSARELLAERVRRYVLENPHTGYWTLHSFSSDYNPDVEVYELREFRADVENDPWGRFLEWGRYADNIDEGLRYVLRDSNRYLQEDVIMSVGAEGLAEACKAAVLYDDRFYDDLRAGVAPVPVSIHELAVGSKNAKRPARKPSARPKGAKAAPRASKAAKRVSGRPSAKKGGRR